MFASHYPSKTCMKTKIKIKWKTSTVTKKGTTVVQPCCLEKKQIILSVALQESIQIEFTPNLTKLQSSIEKIFKSRTKRITESTVFRLQQFYLPFEAIVYIIFCQKIFVYVLLLFIFYF